MITNNKKSNILSYNDFCELQMIFVMNKRYNSKEVKMSYTFIYKV